MSRTGVVLGLAAFGLLTLSAGLVDSKAVDPTFGKDEYNSFFKQLSKEEQISMMNLTVIHYLADSPVKPSPKEDESRMKWEVGDLSDNLVSLLLNGGVPVRWQKEFNLWLSQKYGLKQRHYEQYKAKGVFCTEEDECTLQTLANVGGQCCPFG